MEGDKAQSVGREHWVGSVCNNTIADYLTRHINRLYYQRYNIQTRSELGLTK